MLRCCLLFLLVSVHCYAQKPYTDAEGDLFLRLVKQTKEYQAAQHFVDSINLDKNNVPQTLDFKIRYDSNVRSDQFLKGTLTRKLAMMGITLQQYAITYDRVKKKIIKIEGGVSADIH